LAIPVQEEATRNRQGAVLGFRIAQVGQVVRIALALQDRLNDPLPG
jgi:hypothetical protein